MVSERFIPRIYSGVSLRLSLFLSLCLSVSLSVFVGVESEEMNSFDQVRRMTVRQRFMHLTTWT
jgi:hypothetical protein